VTGRVLDKLKALAPGRIDVIAAGGGTVAEQVIAKTRGLGVDAMVQALARTRLLQT
jgi:type III secretion system FlhB-like substrate exporter